MGLGPPFQDSLLIWKFFFLNMSKEFILPNKCGPHTSQPYNKIGVTIEENSFNISFIGTFSTFEKLLNIAYYDRHVMLFHNSIDYLLCSFESTRKVKSNTQITIFINLFQNVFAECPD